MKQKAHICQNHEQFDLKVKKKRSSVDPVNCEKNVSLDSSTTKL